MMTGTRELYCLIGPYRGQIIPYSISAAEAALANGTAREPTEEEWASHRGVEIETATLPPVEIRKKRAPAKGRKKKVK